MKSAIRVEAEQAHAPGPWALVLAGGENDVDAIYKMIVTIYNTSDGMQRIIAPEAPPVFGDAWLERNMADARLIAASPDLLAACKAMFAWCAAEDAHEGTPLHRVELWEAARDAATAAIAKAERR
jgi:hypothetical protein